MNQIIQQTESQKDVLTPEEFMALVLEVATDIRNEWEREFKMGIRDRAQVRLSSR
jgi:hypothetical protein